MLCNITTGDTIELYKGDSLDVEFSVTWEDGTPVDLTNFNARFFVMNTGLTKDSANVGEITIVTPLDLGKLIVHLVPADTNDLNSNYEYTYKAELYDTDGNVYTFKQSAFKLL